MKLIQSLNEAADASVGLVLSYIDGKFEDLDFVKYDSQDPLPSGHSKNLTKSIIQDIKDDGNNDFAAFAKFVRKNYKGKTIEGYSDNTDLLFGPFSDQSLTKLDDAYLDTL